MARTRKRKVLIADDDLGSRFVFSRALAAWGIETVEADSGTDVMARVHEEAFDLLILDLYMPGMNGFELLRKIRRRPAGLLPAPRTAARVPILVVSAESQPESIANAKALGADEYLVKPVDVDAFEGAVTRLLAGQRPRPSSSRNRRS